jgi:hypothetical protein
VVVQAATVCNKDVVAEAKAGTFYALSKKQRNNCSGPDDVAAACDDAP